MKQIKPIQIWTPEGKIDAVFFDARIINDDLETSASFYWNLNAQDEEGNVGKQLIDGNVGMIGEDYQNWDGNNDAAYQFVANTIGVELI